jgi:predicted HTH domain antitoxin
MATITLTLELPEEILIHFNGINEIRRALYEDFIIAQRQQGHISLGKAAELLGMSYSDFFNLLGQKGHSFINANPEELQESYQHFEKMMAQAKQ